jgi:hypothetical protein
VTRAVAIGMWSELRLRSRRLSSILGRSQGDVPPMCPAWWSVTLTVRAKVADGLIPQFISDCLPMNTVAGLHALVGVRQLAPGSRLVTVRLRKLSCADCPAGHIPESTGVQGVSKGAFREAS